MAAYVRRGLLLIPLLMSSAFANPIKVIFDHDGGIDDFVTLLLLLSDRKAVDVLGVTILDADCRIEVAANTTLKLLRAIDAADIPVAISTLQGVNHFPDAWRGSGISIDVHPLINNVNREAVEAQRVKQPGQDFLGELLLAQEEPVVVIATGPLSNIAYVLQTYGSKAANKIQEVWWMGGAINASGNVHYPGHDGSAEWNAFWDPAALGPVWESSVPLIIVPLDATNSVPVTPDLLYRFGPQAAYKYSVLAGTIWSRVVSWVYERPDEPYYAWDTLTAACVMQPDLCHRVDNVEVYAVLAGESQGRTAAQSMYAQQQCVPHGIACPSEHASVVRNVSVITHVDADSFYNFVLNSLRK